jgi:hypothetical protein
VGWVVRVGGTGVEVGQAELEDDGVLVKFYLFDDPVLEVGVEEAFFVAWLPDGLLVDAYEAEDPIDVVHGDGGAEFHQSLVDALLLLLQNKVFVSLYQAESKSMYLTLWLGVVALSCSSCSLLFDSFSILFMI